MSKIALTLVISPWVYIQNLGEEGATCLFFNSKEEAERYAEAVTEFEEIKRFPGDIFQKTLKINPIAGEIL